MQARTQQPLVYHINIHPVLRGTVACKNRGEWAEVQKKYEYALDHFQAAPPLDVRHNLLCQPCCCHIMTHDDTD